MAKKRGNNEGSIVRRKDGLWMAQISIGRNPQTGKFKRSTFYGKTRKEVADKLAKALRDQQQGIFVEPHKLTLGEWLDKWLWEYKNLGLDHGIGHFICSSPRQLVGDFILSPLKSMS